ncbi:MAG: hypothetical protein JRC68_02195 [Deltaproteobacteria bacterium]|nr:hypothetical protein [Deltaproteobacteria bacterium]
MDFLSSSELTIPATQMAMLLMLTTVALLFGRIKLALMITYLFTLYWGYVLNRTYMFKTASESVGHFTWIYFGFGLLVVFFALAGFLRPGRR